MNNHKFIETYDNNLLVQQHYHETYRTKYNQTIIKQTQQGKATEKNQTKDIYIKDNAI